MLRSEHEDEEVGGGGSGIDLVSGGGSDVPIEFVVTSGEEKMLGGDKSTGGCVEYVGRLRVTVVGDWGNVDRLSVVTFHDIGMNAQTCFGQFFECCTDEGIGQYTDSVQFYIDAPGHEEDAPTIATNDPWYSLHDLAEELHRVVIRFRIGRFIGFVRGRLEETVTSHRRNTDKDTKPR